MVALEPTDIASCNAQAPPTPSNATGPPKATPLVVIVLPVVVALNVVVPVYVRVKFVAGKDKLPLTVNPMFDPARVIVKSRPLIVMLSQTLGVFAIVTVKIPPESLPASKNTLSAAVGTDAPVPPPDEADQLAVLVLLQVPVPPTQ